MEVMVDPALDSVHLLVTTESQQWRILVEQRSTGYVWGLEDTGPVSVPRDTRVSNGHDMCDDTSAVQRTRLQSIKQMSVDRIANLRTRLAEGRRLLKSRSEAEMSGATSQTRVECVSSDLDSHVYSVQRDLNMQRYYLSGKLLSFFYFNHSKE